MKIRALPRRCCPDVGGMVCAVAERDGIAHSSPGRQPSSQDPWIDATTPGRLLPSLGVRHTPARLSITGDCPVTEGIDKQNPTGGSCVFIDAVRSAGWVPSLSGGLASVTPPALDLCLPAIAPASDGLGISGP